MRSRWRESHYTSRSRKTKPTCFPVGALQVGRDSVRTVVQLAELARVRSQPIRGEPGLASYDRGGCVHTMTLFRIARATACTHELALSFLIAFPT